MLDGVIHTENQTALSEAVFNYYNFKRNDRNLLQSQHDGLVHHHFGITGTQIRPGASQDEITAEIQRQETAQSEYLIELLNPTKGAKVYDVGCGRGGTMFRMLDKHPSIHVTGINLTEYQTLYCQNEILARNKAFNAEVIQGSFMDSPFRDGQFTHAIINEVTPYALNLYSFFAELDRVVAKNGRVALATWCYNDEKDTSEYWRFLSPICTHYASSMHGINKYREAAGEYFTVVEEINKNNELIDYWELRNEWKLQSGVEPFFLNAHKEDNMRYIFFVLEK